MNISNPLEHYSLEQLRTRSSEKWQNYAEDVLPLWVAEMDTVLPTKLTDMLHNLIDNSDFGYLSKTSFDKYASAFCDFSKRHWGWIHDPNVIMDAADVVSGCRRVIDAWLENDPNNSVIISTPVYPPFIKKYARGYQLIDVPLTDNPADPTQNYRLDFEMLEHAFSECNRGGKRAAYALCNPNNPTGTVHTREELSKLAKLSQKYNVLVVSDEIHGALVTKRNPNNSNHSAFVPYLSIPDADFAVTVTSASKSYSIPGMKAALLIPSAHSSHKAYDLLWKTGLFYQASSEQLGSLSQTVCLNECDEWLKALVDGIDSNLKLFKSLSATYFPKAKFIIPDGTYFVWVDFRAYYDMLDLDKSQSFSKYLLNNAKAAFNDGASFVDCGSNLARVEAHNSFVRINLATSQNIITEACKRIGGSLV